jgi:integrase
VKPATLQSWQSCLNKWLLPNLGDMPLADVANGAMKTLVNKMSAVGLSAKSIVNYCEVVKLVVASAVNAEGEEIYPRKWNHEFVGIPIVDKNKQRRPTLTAEEVLAIVSGVKGQYRILFALLAGTGLRIGEALALKTSDLAPDCRTINVQRSIWQGREQEPKTPNAVRIVDLPESLSQMLREYVADKNGYLFATRNGRPVSQRFVLRILHQVAGRVGLHSFRRFRASVLRKSRVPEDLTKLWLGHADSSITDGYARQLREDIPFRQEWAEKCGLGFQLPEMGYVGLQNLEQIAVANAA